MPMLDCPHCGIRQYAAAPYVADAQCVECGECLAPAKLRSKRLSLPGSRSTEESRAQLPLAAAEGGTP
jgi:hypothetical protein